MKLIDRFDNFIVDLDGVVYIDNKPIPGAKEAIETLRKLEKGIIFLTNDPRSSSDEYAEKLNRMDIATNPSDVITSGVVLACYIKEHYRLSGKKAYVVGTEALREELRAIGLKISYGEEAKTADFVIISGHPLVNYEEMKIATLAARNGAVLLGTNRDPVFPTPEGLVPATGALVAAIEVASEKKAITVGKPEPIMFDMAKRFFQSNGNAAVIGDRLDTDILGGMRAGLGTILVLSGSTKKEDLARSEIKPDYVINAIKNLLEDS